MFDAWCEGCGTRVLLTSRRIRKLSQGDGAIDVHFRCWRGHDGVWHTGRRVAARSAAPTSSAEPATRRPVEAWV